MKGLENEQIHKELKGFTQNVGFLNPLEIFKFFRYGSFWIKWNQASKATFLVYLLKKSFQFYKNK
jgi:hypothetical protein